MDMYMDNLKAPKEANIWWVMVNVNVKVKMNWNGNATGNAM